EISRFIINDLDRGCTFIQGKGAFSENNISILYTVLGRSEFIKLKNYIKEIDNRAFITVGEVHEVLGEGFGEFK
ncbi:MAG: YitT family protein, partial [Clostridiaceae bacterium]